MEARYLVTGVNGFSGRHLAARLAHKAGSVALGTGRQPRSTIPLHGYRACDLTDHDAVIDMVRWARPDVVFHLAGLNGMAAPDAIARVNVAGFEHLCRALRDQARGRQVRLIVIGSAAEFGTRATANVPLTEDAACLPDTAYGRSK
jgi:GDP-4-dehydro-6-deoxy-D-mannose reductase